ncbi:hypothetical protein B9D94_28965 [Paenibacillus sp. Cedars]|nr:hypothetical protein B9D94_28965 [Paenibacillus sp. Cedars]
MKLPQQMMCLVLVEQIYQEVKISRGNCAISDGENFLALLTRQGEPCEGG